MTLNMAWSAEEHEAIEHVRDRTQIDGSHTVKGCPRYFRAICKYYGVLKDMDERGVLPSDVEFK